MQAAFAKRFPDPVQDRIGFVLYQGRLGRKHRDTRPLKGLGSGVLKVVSRHDGDTRRAAYTVRFKAAVYVLHAFRKKAKRGAETPRPDIELVRSRLRTAEQHQLRARLR